MATRTWQGVDGAAWGTTTNWSGNLVPTLADDVVIPAAFSGTIVLSTVARVCLTLVVQAGSAGVTFTGTGATFTVAGTSFTLQSNTAWAATSILTFTSTVGCNITAPVTSAIQGSITLGSASTPSATWKLFSYIRVASTRTLTLTGGKLDLNNNTFEIGLFSSSSTSTRSIAFGSNGTILLTTPNTSTVFSMTTGTGFSYTGFSYILIQAATGGGSGITRTITTTGLTPTTCMNFAVRDDAAATQQPAGDGIVITSLSYLLTLDLANVTRAPGYYTGTLAATTTRYIVGHLFFNYQRLSAPSATNSIIFVDSITSSNTITATNGTSVTLGTAASYTQGTSITIDSSGITNSGTGTVITSRATYFVAASILNSTTVTLASDVYNAYAGRVLTFSTSTVGGTNTVSVGTVKIADFGYSVNLPTISFTGSSSYYILSEFTTVYDLLISTSGTVFYSPNYSTNPVVGGIYTINIGRNLTQTNGKLWCSLSTTFIVTGIVSWSNGTFVCEDGENFGFYTNSIIICTSITITAPYTINLDPYNNLIPLPRADIPTHVTLTTGKPTIVGAPTIVNNRKFGFQLYASANLSAIADTSGVFSYIIYGSGTLSLAGIVARDIKIEQHSGVINYAASFTVRGTFIDGYANTYASGTTVGGTITLQGSGGTQSDPDYINVSGITRQNMVISGSYYKFDNFTFTTVGNIQFTSGTLETTQLSSTSSNSFSPTAANVTLNAGVSFVQSNGTSITVTGNNQTVFSAYGCNIIGTNAINLYLLSGASTGTRSINVGTNGPLFNVTCQYPLTTPSKDTISIPAGITLGSFDSYQHDGLVTIPDLRVIGNFDSSGNVGVVTGQLTLVNIDSTALNRCYHRGASSPNFNVILNGKNTVTADLVGNAGTSVGSVTVNSGTLVASEVCPSQLTVNPGATINLTHSYSLAMVDGSSVNIDAGATVISAPGSKVSMQGALSHVFAGGGHVFDTLELAGVGAVTVTGDNTFNIINTTITNPTLYLAGGSNTKVTQFNIIGTSASRATVASTTSFPYATLTKMSRWSVGPQSSLISTTGLYAEPSTYINYVNFSYINGVVVGMPFIASAFFNFF